MLNTRKSIGLCLCLAGVLLARLNSFVAIQGWVQAVLVVAGVSVALIGLAVFASGLKQVSTTVRICPHCRARNQMAAERCTRC